MFKKARSGRVFAAIFVAITLVASLTSCAPRNRGAAGDRPQIGVAEINLSLPFFVEMQQASQEVATDYGVDITWQSVDGSIERQISTVETFIAQGKDVILIDPVNANALVDVVDRAEKAGVKVITMGNKVAGTANHNTLYPDADNWVRQARILGHHLDGRGKVLLLIGSVGNYVSDTRQRAFEATMAAEFPGITVITQPTDFDSSKAGSVTQAVLTNNPDLAGIASISDGLTLPAVKVVEKSGLRIPFVSNDGNAEVNKYIDSGVVLTNVLTGSHRVGAWNTAVAARLAQGSRFDTDLFMPTHLIASETTARSLRDKGIELETITVAEAVARSGDYLAEFGSTKSDTDMTVPA